MAERNKGARRRKAFADFKENQYNDSFSISESEKRKIFLKNIFKYVFVVLITFIFIAVGFIVSDALLNISETQYNDTKTYLPANTTTQSTTLLPTEPTEETSETESNEGELSSPSDNQNTQEQ